MSSGRERFEFNERMRPVADKLYRAIIPAVAEIVRFDKELSRHILDFTYAIDVELTLANGMKITGQEKFREFNERRERRGLPQYSDVTVELYNDPTTEDKGDWFNLCSQFYFVGFASKDELCFDRYILLNWLSIILETVRGNVIWKTLSNADGRAKANFRYTSFDSLDSLPRSCIIAIQK